MNDADIVIDYINQLKQKSIDVLNNHHKDDTSIVYKDNHYKILGCKLMLSAIHKDDSLEDIDKSLLDIYYALRNVYEISNFNGWEIQAVKQPIEYVRDLISLLKE